MNKLETVSSHQMAIIFLTFMTGSAIINIPSPLTSLAENGAWISLIISGMAGMLLLACTLYLNRQYPAMTFIDYSRKTVGNWLAICLAVPYLIFAVFLVTLIVIDIGGFFTTTMLRETPSYVFHLLILLTASLTARAGIEVMARMFPLLLYSMFGFTVIVLLLASHNFHPEYLLPVMPKGIKPILHGALFLMGFPYGELVVLAMLLPFVKQEKKGELAKFMYWALLVNVFSILIVTLCTIMAFGPLSGEFKFSVFRIARIINVEDFIERVESVIGIALIVASYMKATIALYALNLGVSQLLKLKDDRILFFPLTIICFLLTLVSFKNEAEFSDMVAMVWPLLVIIGGGFPVLILTGVTFVKSALLKSKMNKSSK